MKICICSDSHGCPEGIIRMLSHERPQVLLFLGDGLRDFGRVEIPDGVYFAAVSGNCDMTALHPESRLLTLLDRQVYMSHGHREGVKQGLEGLRRVAEEQGADLVLYGHTHMADAQCLDGRLFLNPGPMKDRDNRYAVLWEEDGNLRYALKLVDWSK